MIAYAPFAMLGILGFAGLALGGLAATERRWLPAALWLALGLVFSATFLAPLLLA